jgi:hypothetical protein
MMMSFLAMAMIWENQINKEISVFKVVYSNLEYSVIEFRKGIEQLHFQSQDIDAIKQYLNEVIGVTNAEFEDALDYSKRMEHNVMEFGYNNMFVISY